MTIVAFILITILTGWWLSTIEVPTGFSGIIAAGAIRKRYLVVCIVLLIIVGGCLFGTRLTNTITTTASLTTPLSSIIIALSASLSVLATYKLSKYSSVCYGVLGAILGWKFFINGSVDYVYSVKILLSWLIAPILAGILAAALYYSYRSFITKSSIHMFVLLRILRGCLILAVVLFTLSVGMNNGALVLALNSTITPGFDFSVNTFDLSEQHILFVFSILIIALITWPKTSSKITEMAGGELDTNIESTLIILISAILVLVFFSVPSLCSAVGLQAVPLSISCIILGAFTGIYPVKKREWSGYASTWKIFASTIVTPLVAFIITYFILRIVDPKSILLNGDSPVTTSPSIINVTPVIITLLVLSFLFLIFTYIKRQKRIREQVESSLTVNQKELFENQKAMSALEIKTVVAENEHLNYKLELRRNELINVALNISEQKKVLEDLYYEIKSIREINDFEEQKHRIDRIEMMLLQKMNFSQEMESFYVQTEKLHKDFSLRLSEKFPNLTEQERRLITLLRLGFSSKHIASLMNISPKSVEISRYRLRAKIGLARKDNLIQFIKLI